MCYLKARNFKVTLYEEVAVYAKTDFWWLLWILCLCCYDCMLCGRRSCDVMWCSWPRLMLQLSMYAVAMWRESNCVIFWRLCSYMSSRIKSALFFPPSSPSLLPLSPSSSFSNSVCEARWDWVEAILIVHVLATHCIVKPLAQAHGFSGRIKVWCLHT